VFRNVLLNNLCCDIKDFDLTKYGILCVEFVKVVREHREIMFAEFSPSDKLQGKVQAFKFREGNPKMSNAIAFFSQ
jgi:hypothetical protein